MKRIFFNILGMLCLVVGLVNRFIPGMPTTPFLILSSMLFAKVNPKMQAWLLKTKFLGPYLDNYYNKKGLPTVYKLRTCAFMFAGMFFAVTLVPFWWLQVLIPAIGVAVTIHIFAIKKREPSKEQRGVLYNLKTIAFCWIWIGLGLFMASEAFDYYVMAISGGAITLIVLTYALASSRKTYE